MKDQFDFQNFTIRQDRCAMKVGTDGVLLGAWAQGGGRILDIGAGTGLISLMMAQRFPESRIYGIDIDSDACGQARENVAASKYADRVEMRECSLQTLATFGDDAHVTPRRFDAIVSNPPFFENSMKNPDSKRQMARHTDTLSYQDLFRGVDRLLEECGVFSMIVPAEGMDRVLSESCISGLFLSSQYGVKTTSRKQPKRYLLAFTKRRPCEVDVQTVNMLEADGLRSEWYRKLTDEFYLY